MRPVLFHVGSWPVPSHEAFIFLGVVAATFVFWREAERRGPLDERLLWIVAGTLVRRRHRREAGNGMALRHAHSRSLARRAFSRGEAGASSADSPERTSARCSPSASSAIVAAPATCSRRPSRSGWRSGASGAFSPSKSARRRRSRGDCGSATRRCDRFPTVRTARPGVALHPSFLYEIAFHAVMFVALLTYWRPRVTVEGDLFKIYLLAYAIFRFFVEFVRGNPVLWNGLTGSQLFLIPSTLLLAGYFVRRRWVDRNPHPPIVVGEVAR